VHRFDEGDLEWPHGVRAPEVTAIPSRSARSVPPPAG
jgi:hypothetical protein